MSGYSGIREQHGTENDQEDCGGMDGGGALAVGGSDVVGRHTGCLTPAL